MNQIKELTIQLENKNLELISMAEKLKGKGTTGLDKKMFDSLDKLENEYVTSLVQKLESSYKLDQALKFEELELKIAQKDTKILQLTSELTASKIEKELLEKNIDEIKQITTAREMNRVTEIQSLKMNNEQLIEISERREKIILEENEKHREEVIFFQNVKTECR